MVSERSVHRRGTEVFLEEIVCYDLNLYVSNQCFTQRPTLPRNIQRMLCGCMIRIRQVMKDETLPGILVIGIVRRQISCE